MSDGMVTLILTLGIPGAIFLIGLIAICWSEITEFFRCTADSLMDAVKYPFVKYKDNREMNCFHTWRKLDVDYSHKEAIYRYRCFKCKKDKKIRENNVEHFEKEFASDPYDRSN